MKPDLKSVDAAVATASAADNSNAAIGAKAAAAPGMGFPPIAVGNPAAASSLAIDQRHMEEFVTNSSAQSSVVECRRPPKGMFFTVRAESGTWKDRSFFFLLELPGRDPYIVAEPVARVKQDDEDTIRPILLVRYVTMTGDEGLWPLKLNPPDGKANPWNTSALNILELAGTSWVRIVSLKGHYRHQVSKKTFEQAPPKFTDRPFGTLVDMAFKDHVISTLEHEIWDELENGRNK